MTEKKPASTTLPEPGSEQLSKNLSSDGVQYQLEPETLVRLLEPAYGNRDGKGASGFPEEEIRTAEERLGVRIPERYRRYLLECGKAGLNEKMHYILPPEELSLSHDVIAESIRDEWEPEWEEYGPDPENPYYQINQLPRERWGEITGNYLMIWVENQGCFYAGIRAENLDKESPPVSLTTDDDYFEWAVVSNSIESFLLFMLMEFLAYVPQSEIEGKDAINAYLAEHGLDAGRLFPSKMPYDCLYTRTFWNNAEKMVGVCLLNNGEDGGEKGAPSKLYLFPLERAQKKR